MELPLARRLLRSIYRSLVAYGTMYTGVDPDGSGGTALASARKLRGPGPAHPERVRLDAPLTRLERAHLRELRSR
ncbi:hypothetical protein J7I98_38130 [Streptomyces sp. ISL-98]|uniref:DUF6059 family protein n=1 Tax=Streptomyces sp. ISL-98 TaxID=2819192 RepID=UPI001BED06AE|nr:DUF6059 family protein [Streptomyces sp. ISL-98]MBT2511514.1 hypothetical protein [Streptomyces sp. ISL-98]